MWRCGQVGNRSDCGFLSNNDACDTTHAFGDPKDLAERAIPAPRLLRAAGVLPRSIDSHRLRPKAVRSSSGWASHQVWRVRRQVEQFDFQELRQSRHDFALLTARVVENQRDGDVVMY